MADVKGDLQETCACGSWWPGRMPEGISRALKTYMCATALNLPYLDNFHIRLKGKDQSLVLLTSPLKQALHAKPQTALDGVNWHC